MVKVPQTRAAEPSGRHAAASKKMEVVVYAKSDLDEIGIETLVGEYIETGANHGRKVFKRNEVDDDDQVVYIYYWDTRDGAEFSGWWFGDQIGGAQVWSRCDKADMLPPSAGWRIPWDGDIIGDLGVDVRKPGAFPRGSSIPVKKEQTKEEPEEPVIDNATSAENEERIQRATDRVIIAEIEASQALESVSAMMEGEVNEEALKAVEELLTAQQATMTEAHKVLAAEIMEARKKAPKVVGALRKLTPRLRSVQASLAHEAASARQTIAARKQDAFEEAARETEMVEQLEAEKENTKTIEEALPGLMDLVAQAEDLTTTCASSAAPLLDEFKEDLTEAVTVAFDEVERAANKAQAAVKSARQKVSLCITAAKQFAPKPQKVAMKEYPALQERLSKAQKKLNPYLRMRKDHEHKLEAKRAMSEADGKLVGVESEVQKLMGLLSRPQAGEEELKSIHLVIAPILSSVNSALKFVDHHIDHAQAKFKEELVEMQARGKKAKARIEEFRSKLKTQAHSVQLNLLLQKSLDKVATAEDLLVEASAAEEPFLKSDIEGLPAGEASEALEKCERVTKLVEVAVREAEAYLKARLDDTEKFQEDLREIVSEELAQLQLRMDAASQKVMTFKRETATRKASLVLSKVAKGVADAEMEVARAADTTSALSPEGIAAAPLNELSTLVPAALEAEKAAALACAEARAVLNAKQKEGPGKDASPAFVAELSKLNARLSNAAQELQKHRKVALAAEKTYKGKQTLQDKEEEMNKVEAEIERIDIMTTPLGGDEPSDKEVADMDLALSRVNKSLAGVLSALQPMRQSTSSPSGALLGNLLARAEKAQEQVNDVATQTQEMRERVQCDYILREARFKVAKVDESLQRSADAEAPYLKGLEVLPLEEAATAVAESGAAITAVQQAISEARSFLATKSLEIRKFTEVVTHPGLAEISTLSSQNEAFVVTLDQFRQQTHKRKNAFLLQEAAAKVAAAEEAVQRTILQTNPLAGKDAEEMVPQVLQELCENLAAIEKEAQAKLDEARRFVSDRQKAKQGSHDPAELSSLLSSLNNAQIDLAKAKATTSDYEQRFVAGKVTLEVKEMVEHLNKEIDATAQASAPLDVEGSTAIAIGSMTQVVLDGLRKHCSKNSLSSEDLFKQVSGGKPTVDESSFVTFLQKVPELVSHQALVLSKQGAAIFNVVDGDRDGVLSLADFQQCLCERFVCVHSIAITNGLDISTADTLERLQVGDIVDGAGKPKIEEALGIARVEIRKAGITGWVTMKGNQGTVYLEPLTAYNSFIQHLEKLSETAQAALKDTSAFVAQKIQDVRECHKGPLAEIKATLAQLKPQVGMQQARLERVKKRIAQAKQEEKKKRALVGHEAISEVSLRSEATQDAGPQQKLLLALDSTIDAASDGTQTASSTSASKMLGKVSSALRDSLKKRKVGVEALFSELARKKADGIPMAEITKYLEQMKHCNLLDLLPEQMQALLQQVAIQGVVTRHRFADLFQHYLSCVKEVSITADFEVKVDGSKRKLAAGEIVEVLEGPKRDDALGIVRFRVKPMLDGKEGWVTARGNDGAVYMKACGKPRYVATRPVLMEDACPRKGAKALAPLGIHEVVDVIEGPRREKGNSVRRAQVKTADGVVGWIGFTNDQGQDCGQPGHHCYITTSSIALTNGLSIKTSKVLKKLDEGEALECVEGPMDDEAAGCTRIKVVTQKEKIEGWVTIKGNAGSSYAEKTGQMYVLSRQTDLQTGFSSSSSVVSTLENGARIELTKGPSEEASNSELRVKCQVADRGQIGWVTLEGDNLKPWGPRYRCVNSTAINDILDVSSEDAKMLRKLEAGETVELLEGPRLEAHVGMMRIRARAERDGVTGWITIAGNQGKPFLKVARDQ